MTYTLINCGHTHETIEDGKRCIGLIKDPPRPRAYTPSRDWKDDAGTMSRAQHGYLRHQLNVPDKMLRRDNGRGKPLSMNEASQLIDDIKAGKVHVPMDIQDTPEETLDPKLEFVKGMLESLPDGRFAVRKDENEPLRFVRVSTGGKKSRYAGCRKIQTQHSDDLILRAALWPSGKFYTYAGFRVEDVLLAIADPEGTAIAYGRELGVCCRCGKTLTDERSRHYGIGPECEKHWPEVIARVDEEQRLAEA